MVAWLIFLLPNLIRSEETIYITSIVPPAGPTTGNTRVLVRGKGLDPNPDYPNPVCKFGLVSNVVKATYVRCSENPRDPNTKDPITQQKTVNCLQCDPGPAWDHEDMVPFMVSLSGDFRDAENSLEFQYYKPPKIHWITPIYGPRNGGTIVTVYGENFIDFD